MSVFGVYVGPLFIKLLYILAYWLLLVEELKPTGITGSWISVSFLVLLRGVYIYMVFSLSLFVNVVYNLSVFRFLSKSFICRVPYFDPDLFLFPKLFSKA